MSYPYGGGYPQPGGYGQPPQPGYPQPGGFQQYPQGNVRGSYCIYINIKNFYVKLRKLMNKFAG